MSATAGPYDSHAYKSCVAISHSRIVNNGGRHCKTLVHKTEVNLPWDY